VVTLTSGLVVVPQASADQISDLRAQASALAARIQQLGNQEDALSEQYDADQINVQALDAKVAQAAKQVVQAATNSSKARSALAEEAVQAYVRGGANPLTTTANALTNANESLLGAEYVNTLATDESDAIDQFRLAAVQDQTARQNLQQEQAAAKSAVQQVNADRSQVVAVQGQLQGELSQDTGQIATLVAQQQAAEEAAAQQAAQARLAAQQAAAQQAAQAAQAAAAAQEAAAETPATTTVAPTQPASPLPIVIGSAPPPSSLAARAVQYAESRVGDPYVWGAAGPNSFDCSGLVMWSYEQVGIDLPHYSGDQYADTTHISMSDLEPGDLVFPADPGQHVAMYIGNGMIVQAPYTGADVQIIPLSNFFVLASRVT
jgi:cell wall-associated NlpC family hydrolase